MSTLATADTAITFTLDGTAWNGELAEALDKDPFNIGWPKAGNVKSAVVEALFAVGVSEAGSVKVTVNATVTMVSIEVTSSADVPAPVATAPVPEAPPATDAELARSQAPEGASVFTGTSGVIVSDGTGTTGTPATVITDDAPEPETTTTVSPSGTPVDDPDHDAAVTAADEAITAAGTVPHLRAVIASHALTDVETALAKWPESQMLLAAKAELEKLAA